VKFPENGDAPVRATNPSGTENIFPTKAIAMTVISTRAEGHQEGQAKQAYPVRSRYDKPAWVKDKQPSVSKAPDKKRPGTKAAPGKGAAGCFVGPIPAGYV
jgi:hypothetical protein